MYVLPAPETEKRLGKNSWRRRRRPRSIASRAFFRRSAGRRARTITVCCSVSRRRALQSCHGSHFETRRSSLP